MMKTYTLFILTLVGQVVRGLPQDSNSAATECQNNVDNFDSLPANPSFPEEDPVGKINGTKYSSSWSVGKGDLLYGVTPHSGNQVAITFHNYDTTNISGIPLYAYASLEAAPGTFDLLSFWWGCNVNSEERFGSGSTECTIAVIGLDRKGKQGPITNFTFTPTQQVGAPLILAKLPASFSGIKNVTIGLADAPYDPTDTNIIIDDVKHRNCVN